MLPRHHYKNFCKMIKYSTLPLLIIVYPAVFHYANNARLVRISSVLELGIFLSGIGMVVYLVLVVFSQGQFDSSALGAAIIIALFYLYEPIQNWVRSLDVLQIETYNFAPFYGFAIFYLGGYLGHKLKNDWMWKYVTSVVVVLLAVNIARAIPREIDKWDKKSNLDNGFTKQDVVISTHQYPDIYYLIFDEAAGFEVARRYWNYNKVDDLIAFFKEKGFYVAELSHGGSIYTLHEIATRLNFQEYPVGSELYSLYDDAIVHNKVMKFLRERGYILVAYDQRRVPFPTFSPLPVDLLFEKSPVEHEISGVWGFMDEYKYLVLQSTLLGPFMGKNVDQSVKSHRSMIDYVVSNVPSSHVPSPKFVYVHLMLPHNPFAFTEFGDVVQRGYYNWQKYFDNYKFSLRVMRTMVENILISANPQHPPVIIVQSDHGARNLKDRPYTGNLENYPQEYTTWIVNALYLPGCENAPLTQDMDPINTFPIVFNCYFGTNIPLK